MAGCCKMCSCRRWARDPRVWVVRQAAASVRAALLTPQAAFMILSIVMTGLYASPWRGVVTGSLLFAVRYVVGLLWATTALVAMPAEVSAPAFAAGLVVTAAIAVGARYLVDAALNKLIEKSFSQKPVLRSVARHIWAPFTSRGALFAITGCVAPLVFESLALRIPQPEPGSISGAHKAFTPTLLLFTSALLTAHDSQMLVLRSPAARAALRAANMFVTGFHFIYLGLYASSVGALTGFASVVLLYPLPAVAIGLLNVVVTQELAVSVARRYNPLRTALVRDRARRLLGYNEAAGALANARVERWWDAAVQAVDTLLQIVVAALCSVVCAGSGPAVGAIIASHLTGAAELPILSVSSVRISVQPLSLPLQPSATAALEVPAVGVLSAMFLVLALAYFYRLWSRLMCVYDMLPVMDANVHLPRDWSRAASFTATKIPKKHFTQLFAARKAVDGLSKLWESWSAVLSKSAAAEVDADGADPAAAAVGVADGAFAATDAVAQGGADAGAPAATGPDGASPYGAPLMLKALRDMDMLLSVLPALMDLTKFRIADLAGAEWRFKATLT